MIWRTALENLGMSLLRTVLVILTHPVRSAWIIHWCVYTADGRSPITDERNKLRKQQAKKVMPMIGGLLDAWDACREWLGKEAINGSTT